MVIARRPESGRSFDWEGSLEGVVILLVLLAPAAGLMVLGVRTWLGTAAASLGMVALWTSGIALMTADSASTAGVGLLGMPVVAAVPVVAAISVERWSDRRSLSPTPDDDADQPRLMLGCLGCYDGLALDPANCGGAPSDL